MECRNHKKPEARMDAVDIAKLHSLRRQKTLSDVIRHTVVQKEQRGGRTVLFPFHVISDSKIWGPRESKIYFFKKAAEQMILEVSI